MFVESSGAQRRCGNYRKVFVLSNISINKIQTTINGEGLRLQGEAFFSHDDITLSEVRLKVTI